jgi:hypothetical protein
MRRTLIVSYVAFGLVAAVVLGGARQLAAQQSRTPAGIRDRFVGTWRLVGTDQLGPDNAILPPPAGGRPNQIGYIIYDPSGHVAVTIMNTARPKYAGAQPTASEAQAVLSGYTSYFGSFSVNEAEGVVTHRLQGSLNPTLAAEQPRWFEFSENRLMLKPPRNKTTGNQARLTWEKMPDLARGDPAYKKFIGFWKLVSNERRTLGGERIGSNPGQTGFIIYTAAGHMAVHMMQPGRKPYAAAQPTPEEALEALRTYTSYFGPYTVHDSERPPYVVHHRIGLLNPSQIGTDAQRFFEFSGRRLLLKPPVSTVEGRQVQGVITWERLEAAAPTGN